MSETGKHTPGPWRVLNYASDNKGYIAVIAEGNPQRHICDVFPFGKRAKGQLLAEHKANARLITAAPDMLASGSELDRLALIIESAVRTADPSRHEIVVAALKANNIALSKAKGTP